MMAAPMNVRKAIMPVAGLGTRFLPATKAQPKEMLSLVDKPVIQYIVEEAVASGIEQIIFVTSGSKRAIEDHFDRNFELEFQLERKHKSKELAEILGISELAEFVYVRQQVPRGDGHAILAAASLVGDEPVAVMFGDDVIDAKRPAMRQLIDAFEEYHQPIIGIQEIDRTQTGRFGIIAGTAVSKRTFHVESLVEKPKPADAPSNLGVIGRYVITPQIMRALEHADPSADGEIRLIDAFRAVVHDYPLYAHAFEGVRYDCGNKLEFMKASVEMALRHNEIGDAFGEYLKRF